MAKWNFFATNSSLIKELDTSGDDVNPQSQSFLAPTLDLQGPKIVFKEGGLYKTAILFTEIGTIDGVNPTDLQDAYDKIIDLIPNSSGGIPNLTQVLTQGDRGWDGINEDYTFQGIDIARMLIQQANVGTPIFTIDGDLDNDFPLNCVLKFQSYLLPSQLQATNGVLIYVKGNPGSVTTYNFNIGDYCELKKLNTKQWFLNVSNASNDPIPTKTSELINDGDNGTSHFITLEDLPSNLILYPTTVSSGIGGYNKLVSSITDSDYNTTAVNVSTGAITGTDQLIAGLITSPNIIVGNPGIFNITTIGNIRKTTGSGQAEFYFRVYKRDVGGTETLILQSSNTSQITSAIYTEFSATGLWNDGVFISTDMIVMKFYGTKVGSGSSPTYDFQFGGTQPVRTLVPIPLNVVPNLSLDELTDVNISTPTNNQLLSYTSATDLWENKKLIDILEKFNATQGVYFFDDFLGTNDNAGIATSTGVTMSAVGTGSAARITGAYPNRTNQQGVIQLATGTLITGGASFRLGSGNTPTFFVGSGAISHEVLINIETLSTLANRFVNVFGFYTGSSITTSNNLISFIYDEGGVFASGGLGASPNWKCVTGNAGTRTSTDSTIAVTASAWTKLRIEINANATSVGFYINDTLVATNASNIPATTTAMYFLNGIQKTTGLTSINMYADYFSLKQTFTTAR